VWEDVSFPLSLFLISFISQTLLAFVTLGSTNGGSLRRRHRRRRRRHQQHQNQQRLENGSPQIKFSQISTLDSFFTAWVTNL